MKTKKRPFSNLQFEGWRNLINFGIVCFYCIIFISSYFHGTLGGDYVQYWIAGKIADDKGYSNVYSLSELRNVKEEILADLGYSGKDIDTAFSPLPLGYFSIFIIPFQFLSRLSIKGSYLLWTFLNFALLVGYLFFFFHKTTPTIRTFTDFLKLLIPILISYAVFFNITCGQVEVFVLIFTGEFVRAATNKKPILSGLWLGGLLLKPPLLVLIIPIFLFLRYWKLLFGFIISSGIVLGTSIALSGLNGMLSLFNIWTNVTGETAPTAPEIMINWRMVGINLSQVINPSFAWTIAGFGIALTLLAVLFLIVKIPLFGSPSWIITILGVFSATLSLTWHSHYHMAMVMIPFLVFALVQNLLPQRRILSWCAITPLVFIGTILFETVFFAISKINPVNLHTRIIALCGLSLNSVILFSVLQALTIRSVIKK